MAAARLPVAIVTGTNSGLGLALVVALAEGGHRVYAGMRGLTSSKASELAAAVSASGVDDRVVTCDLDVNESDSVDKAIGAAIEAEGRVDVLVNNAGYVEFGSVEMLSIDSVHAQFETNVYGAIRCQRAVLPTMRAQRSGTIVNISSVGGVWGQPFNDVYCASKFALEGLSESQAPVFATFGVSVTNVQPGAIATPFSAKAGMPDFDALPGEYGPAIQSTMRAYQASGASAAQTPEEVAAVVMDRVVRAESAPPLKVQTNPAIQGVFEMQLADVTGATGVAAAAGRFLSDV